MATAGGHPSSVLPPSLQGPAPEVTARQGGDRAGGEGYGGGYGGGGGGYGDGHGGGDTQPSAPSLATPVHLVGSTGPSDPSAATPGHSSGSTGTSAPSSATPAHPVGSTDTLAPLAPPGGGFRAALPRPSLVSPSSPSSLSRWDRSGRATD